MGSEVANDVDDDVVDAVGGVIVDIVVSIVVVVAGDMFVAVDVAVVVVEAVDRTYMVVTLPGGLSPGANMCMMGESHRLNAWGKAGIELLVVVMNACICH